MYVEIYHDPETGEFTVITDDFDDFSTYVENEALDEATSRSEETGFEIRRY